MKIAHVMFALLLAMCATLVVAAFVPEPAAGHVADHPDFSTMARTVDGPDSVRLRVVGGVFAALQVGLFVSCIALGIRRSAGKTGLLLGIGAALYLASIVLLVATHLYYAGDPQPQMWWGFPRPTAVMLFLVWPVPAWFVVLYVWKFDSWIVEPDTEDQLQSLAKSHRRREGAH